MKMLSLLFVAGLAATALSAANSADSSKREISFSKDVQPLFSARCTMCHQATDHMGELVLDPGLSFDQLVNVPAVGAAKYSRVKPGRPEASYLVMKIDDLHGKVGGKGWVMPPPTNPAIRLSSFDKDTIRLWIAQGAKRN